MPIEIRELIVRATIESAIGKPGNRGDRQGGQGNSGPLQEEEIINVCVEKIIQYLKERNGR